jgi:hypothetical protein
MGCSFRGSTRRERYLANTGFPASVKTKYCRWGKAFTESYISALGKP